MFNIHPRRAKTIACAALVFIFNIASEVLLYENIMDKTEVANQIVPIKFTLTNRLDYCLVIFADYLNNLSQALQLLSSKKERYYSIQIKVTLYQILQIDVVNKIIAATLSLH